MHSSPAASRDTGKPYAGPGNYYRCYREGVDDMWLDRQGRGRRLDEQRTRPPDAARRVGGGQQLLLVILSEQRRPAIGREGGSTGVTVVRAARPGMRQRLGVFGCHALQMNRTSISKLHVVNLI